MGTREPVPGKRARVNGSKSGELVLSCPEHLSSDVAAVWEHIVPGLASLGLIASVDFYVLERYCRCIVEEWSLTDFIAEHGLSCELVSKEGTVYHTKYTEVGERNSVRSHLSKMESQLGLTQAARTRIQAEPVKEPGTTVRKRKR